MVGIYDALVHIGTMLLHHNQHYSGPQNNNLPLQLLVLDQFLDQGYPLHILGKPHQTHHGQWICEIVLC